MLAFTPCHGSDSPGCSPGRCTGNLLLTSGNGTSYPLHERCRITVTLKANREKYGNFRIKVMIFRKSENMTKEKQMLLSLCYTARRTRESRALHRVMLLTERQHVFGELHSKTPVWKHNCM